MDLRIINPVLNEAVWELAAVPPKAFYPPMPGAKSRRRHAYSGHKTGNVVTFTRGDQYRMDRDGWKLLNGTRPRNRYSEGS